jgi:hypothetical protein
MKEVTIGQGLAPIPVTSTPITDGTDTSLVDVGVGVSAPFVGVGKSWELF